MEHPVGFEPTAICLQGSCSTIELREQIAGIRGPAPHQEECQGNFVFYHDISIHYVRRYFVQNLSQVLQLGHAVPANGISLDGLVHSAVQLRPADVQLVTQSVAVR